VRAVKLKGRVEPDHTLRVRLPEDVGEGPAEVIVLLPERTGTKPSLPAVLTSLQDASRHRRRKAEIDQALEEERAAWDS
jgi:hypothetical protein